jgi:hypothetical protein
MVRFGGLLVGFYFLGVFLLFGVLALTPCFFALWVSWQVLRGSSEGGNMEK